MSQLDYLWVNYADFSVSNTPNDNPNTILTQEAVLSILKEFGDISSVDIVLKGGLYYLVVTDSEGSIVNEKPIPSGISIQSFTKRTVTQSDRDKGCELPLNTPVYSILLSDGNEYLAPIDTYNGYVSRTIITSIIDNSIYAELKINNQSSIISLQDTSNGLSAGLKLSQNGSVLLSETESGLQGDIVLQNSDKFVKFCLLTIEEYEQLSQNNQIDDSTMYFIEGARFFYWGKYLMAGSEESIVLDNYYTKQEVNQKLDQYVLKDQLQQELDKVTITWNDL